MKGPLFLGQRFAEQDEFLGKELWEIGLFNEKKVATEMMLYGHGFTDSLTPLLALVYRALTSRNT